MILNVLEDYAEAHGAKLRGNGKLVANNFDVKPFFYCLSEIPIHSKYSFANKNALNISRIRLNLSTARNVDYKRLENILREILKLFTSFYSLKLNWSIQELKTK